MYTIIFTNEADHNYAYGLFTTEEEACSNERRVLDELKVGLLDNVAISVVNIVMTNEIRHAEHIYTLYNLYEDVCHDVFYNVYEAFNHCHGGDEVIQLYLL